MNDQATKELSIVIVSYNTKEVLRECLLRVREHAKDLDHETFVVDNASHDGSAKMVSEEFPEVQLIASSKNVGFAAGNNLALRRAHGKFLLLLNSDAYLLPDVLESTLSFIKERPRCGILGVKLVGEDDVLQPSAREIPSPWQKFLVISGIASRFPHSKFLGGPDYSWWDHSEVKEVGWVVGAYFLFRREVAQEIGLLDERYFLYFEEIDYCLQAKRAGWEVLFFPDAKVIHLGGVSSMTTQKRISSSGRQLLDLRVKTEFRFYRKNFGLLRLLAAAGVELFWMSVVWCKNLLLGRGEKGALKREESRVVISTILKTLRQDHFGTLTTP